MQKSKIYVLAGLLLCSASAFAQSNKKPSTAERKNQVALPVGPALPGEEKLSAQERAERDFLMPIRRKKVLSKVEEAQQTVMEVTARNLEAVEATEAEEAAAPAAKSVTHTSRRGTYHRRSTAHRASAHSTKRKTKTTSKSHASKTKHVTKSGSKRHR